MPADYLRLALLGGFKVGLSSALPAFLGKASSCIVSPTRSLPTTQRHARPRASRAHEHRAPFWVLRVHIARGSGCRPLRGVWKPWEAPSRGWPRTSHAHTAVHSVPRRRGQELRAGLGPPQAPGKSQGDIPPPAQTCSQFLGPRCAAPRAEDSLPRRHSSPATETERGGERALLPRAAAGSVTKRVSM